MSFSRLLGVICVLILLCCCFSLSASARRRDKNVGSQRYSKNNSSPPTSQRFMTFDAVDNVNNKRNNNDNTEDNNEEDDDVNDDDDENGGNNNAERLVGRQEEDELELMMSSDNSDSTASESGMATDMPNGKAYDIYSCCALVFGSCRSSCENLPLVQLADADNSGRGIRLELKKFCPSMQFEFWSCMNRTLDAVSRGVEWAGRRCCELGLAPRCRNACATSTSTDELINACRQSDEQHMFSCFERQEAGDHCCSNARTSECLQVCRDIFARNAPRKRNNRQRLYDLCSERDQDVIQCVRNITDLTPASNSYKYLPCCEFSKDDTCRNTCRSALNTNEGTDIIIAELEAGGCGMPMPHLPLWQCFLTADRKIFAPSSVVTSSTPAVSQINEIGIDSAKLHCCPKASSPKCRRLCTQTYSTDWTSSSMQFELQCLIHPNELELRQCIDEVDESCQLGCDGLSFCTNFNNRPTELFRSCNQQADAAAQADLSMWQRRGFVSLPGINLPIKNMTRCAPEKWQAIACVLQIKPCTRAGHYNHVCYEDCYEILSECMDWSRVNGNINAVSICMRLHPEEEQIPCVSLRPYLEASTVPKDASSRRRITVPCKGHSCNSSEVCVARRNESSSYDCVPGCSLGETSSFLVPFGRYVRVPIYTTIQRGGFKVCRCGENGRIEHCQSLPSFSYDNCMLPGGRSFRHGTSFYLECNLCSCFAEEITCTKKQCRLPGLNDVAFTSLPCNCPAQFIPVCGRNGNTYHSACIAKCLGLQESELEYGACSTRNPCQAGAFSCPLGTQCLEQRQVCMSSMHRPCLQYTCVNQTRSCSRMGQPVCDMKGVTHPSACDLLNSHAEFGHWGPCFRSCSWKGPVCGINGVTYKHECAAWADFALVDYRAACREIGLLASDMGKRCRSVRCPKPSSVYCQTIVPPGACCPICGGAFRVIYSRKQIDRALYALRGQNKHLVTLRSVLGELDALVEIAECQLSGFLTMEVGVFIAIVPRTPVPTQLQIESCIREAEKIANLIEAQSHRITTNLVLSGLTVAHMIRSTTTDSAASRWCLLQPQPTLYFAAISVTIVLMIFRRNFLIL